MNFAEVATIITLAGEEASRRLPSHKRRTRRGISIHEAAHCIVGFRLGRPVHRVALTDDGGGFTDFSTDGDRSPMLRDGDRARAIAEIHLHNESPMERRFWLYEMRRRAAGLVDKHWKRIEAVAAVLDACGWLSGDQVQSVIAQSEPAGSPLGPPAPRSPSGLPTCTLRLANGSKTAQQQQGGADA